MQTLEQWQWKSEKFFFGAWRKKKVPKHTQIGKPHPSQCLRIREALQEANRNKANFKFEKFKFKI